MRLLVDFQAARDDGYLSSSLDYAISDGYFVVPVAGDRVLVDDGESHTAVATVRDVRGLVVDMTVDWSTWRDNSELVDFVDDVDFYDAYRAEFRPQYSSTGR